MQFLRYLGIRFVKYHYKPGIVCKYVPLSVSTSIAMWRLRLAGCWCGLVSVVMVITSEPSAGVRGAAWLSEASSCPAYAENTRLTGHSLCSTQCTMCCSLTCSAWSCTVQMSAPKPVLKWTTSELKLYSFYCSRLRNIVEEDLLTQTSVKENMLCKAIVPKTAI